MYRSNRGGKSTPKTSHAGVCLFLVSTSVLSCHILRQADRHFDQTRQVLSQAHGTTLLQEGALVAIADNIAIALSKYAAAPSRVGPAVLWAKCRADVRWVRGELFKFRPLDKDDALPMVRKACAGEMRWRPGGRPGSESVHSTPLATLAEQNRCQVGPTILFDRPRQDRPVLASIVSVWAPAPTHPGVPRRRQPGQGTFCCTRTHDCL
jgi:hypothetical protein